MTIPLQITLENEKALLVPLKDNEFEELYAVASDEKIWEQHPSKDRWKREVFQSFFDGAIQSKGAFKIIDKESGAVAGSTRMYDYKEEDRSILIGYTFYATRFWGKGLNPSVKQLMLDYIFQFVDKVYFQVGAANYRSQIAITRVGAKKIGEKNISYYGEPPKPNFVYEIKKEDWVKRPRKVSP